MSLFQLKIVSHSICQFCLREITEVCGECIGTTCSTCHRVMKFHAGACTELNQYKQICSENDPCQDCCDHSDTDDHCCLICDKDLAEERQSRVYDRAKDFRKYGE